MTDQHGHGHGHGHGPGQGRTMTREEALASLERPHWEDRYAGPGRMWSGQPNVQLVAEAADLPPGTALDVGAGEGGDAIWLAGRGWRVTAVDFSAAGLARIAAHAAEAGVEVTTERADVREWAPPAGAFDLVSSQFVHLPAELMAALVNRLAAAVAPGGHLLVVGHHPADLDSDVGRPPVPELMFTAEQLAPRLDPAGWEIVAAGARSREVPGPTGDPVTIQDAVLHARRRAS